MRGTESVTDRAARSRVRASRASQGGTLALGPAALGSPALALAALGPGRGAVALLLAGIAIALMAVLARRQIGGYTGDVLGAFQQIGEIVMLLVAAVR